MAELEPQSRKGPSRGFPGRATEVWGIITQLLNKEMLPQIDILSADLLGARSALQRSIGGSISFGTLSSHGFQLGFGFLWNEHVVGDAGNFLCLAPGSFQHM